MDIETVAYDHRTIEAWVRALWADHEVYRYDRAGTGPVFSVDTPPPYVSADHLHVGHAMSYSQPDFLVRFRRMRGERVFYPMGFDDNGLPTERYVERTHQVRARDLPRAEFVELCLRETARTAAGYEQLWRRLGLSVDWSLRYSTIEPRSQRLAQASFLALYARGEITRAVDPIRWCPECRTALAQADVDDLPRTAALDRVAFAGPDGSRLEVATTRPELLPVGARRAGPASGRPAGHPAGAAAPGRGAGRAGPAVAGPAPRHRRRGHRAPGRHDATAAYQAVSRFFWSGYCDRYLESLKSRFAAGEQGAPDSARTTLWWSFRTLLGCTRRSRRRHRPAVSRWAAARRRPARR